MRSAEKAAVADRLIEPPKKRGGRSRAGQQVSRFELEADARIDQVFARTNVAVGIDRAAERGVLREAGGIAERVLRAGRIRGDRRVVLNERVLVEDVARVELDPRCYPRDREAVLDGRVEQRRGGELSGAAVAEE